MAWRSSCLLIFILGFVHLGFGKPGITFLTGSSSPIYSYPKHIDILPDGPIHYSSGWSSSSSSSYSSPSITYSSYVKSSPITIVKKIPVVSPVTIYHSSPHVDVPLPELPVQFISPYGHSTGGSSVSTDGRSNAGEYLGSQNEIPVEEGVEEEEEYEEPEDVKEDDKENLTSSIANEVEQIEEQKNNDAKQSQGGYANNQVTSGDSQGGYGPSNVEQAQGGYSGSSVRSYAQNEYQNDRRQESGRENNKPDNGGYRENQQQSSQGGYQESQPQQSHGGYQQSQQQIQGGYQQSQQQSQGGYSQSQQQQSQGGYNEQGTKYRRPVQSQRVQDTPTRENETGNRSGGYGAPNSGQYETVVKYGPPQEKPNAGDLQRHKQQKLQSDPNRDVEFIPAFSPNVAEGFRDEQRTAGGSESKDEDSAKEEQSAEDDAPTSPPAKKSSRAPKKPSIRTKPMIVTNGLTTTFFDDIHHRPIIPTFFAPAFGQGLFQPAFTDFRTQTPYGLTFAPYGVTHHTTNESDDSDDEVISPEPIKPKKKPTKKITPTKEPAKSNTNTPNRQPSGRQVKPTYEEDYMQERPEPVRQERPESVRQERPEPVRQDQQQRQQNEGQGGYDSPRPFKSENHNVFRPVVQNQEKNVFQEQSQSSGQSPGGYQSPIRSQKVIYQQQQPKQQQQSQYRFVEQQNRESSKYGPSNQQQQQQQPRFVPIQTITTIQPQQNQQQQFTRSQSQNFESTNNNGNSGYNFGGQQSQSGQIRQSHPMTVIRNQYVTGNAAQLDSELIRTVQEIINKYDKK